MHRLFRRSGLAAAGALALVATGATPALAHVTVNSTNAVQGEYATVNVKVPTESETASTVGLKLQLPEEHPFASVLVQPHPGWTHTATPTTLDEPIESHGQEITEAVTTVEWTATGPGIAPGEYDEFSLSLGPMPETDSVTFKAIQTYSDGTTASWINVAGEGVEEPEDPAPVLELVPASGDGHGSGAGSAGGASDAAAAGTDAGDTDDGGTATTVALVLGGAGLAAGLVGLWLGLSERRRTS